MSGFDDEDWFVCCSDDEKYTSTGCKKGSLEWYPPPEEMVTLLDTIDKAAKAAADEDEDNEKPVLAFTLDWKCPGRRPPTPTADQGGALDDTVGVASAGVGMPVGGGGSEGAADSQQNRTMNDFEFDTSDEIAPAGTPLSKLTTNKELRGSARKKDDRPQQYSQQHEATSKDGRGSCGGGGSQQPLYDSRGQAAYVCCFHTDSCGSCDTDSNAKPKLVTGVFNHQVTFI